MKPIHWQRLFRALVLGLNLALCACSTGPAMPEAAVEIRGNGRPIVVLASGYGMERSTWKAVADDLSEAFTVFAQDRPGYGRQPDTDRPRDPCTIATETRQALQAAGLPPPYLLVGHSLGGLYQYVFARLYPQETGGLVLLDPTHPRHWETLQAHQPMLASALKTMVMLQTGQAQRNEFRQQTECLDRLAKLPPLTHPSRLLLSRRYRDMEQDFVPHLQALQEDWKALTGVKHPDVLWDSGHHIQLERPEAVVQAVRALAGHPAPPRQEGLLVPVGARAQWTLTIGASRQRDVAHHLGTPDETRTHGNRTVWVYQAPGIRVPLAVSLIPVIGDLAELTVLAQGAVDRYESIVEFDEQGVVCHARRRRVED